MSVRYSEDFKKEVVKAFMAGSKSTSQLAAEFNVAKSLMQNSVVQMRYMSPTIQKGKYQGELHMQTAYVCA